MSSPLNPTAGFAPLTGVRVLDFSHVIAGPLATLFLAQLGAQVTKVENARGGDVMRNNEKGPAPFVALNAGKDCVHLDLAVPEDLARAKALLREADVLVDNLRPGVLESLGLGLEAAQEVNPGIIYCAISGFGRHSPAWGQRPAYDHVIQAATGMAFMAGTEGDPPIKAGFPGVDSATGVLAAFAILAALRERDRTGVGCFLDVSMTAAAMQMMYPFACVALTEGGNPPRVGNQGYSGSPSADFFPTADGGWIAVGANTPPQLAALLDELGMQDAMSDPAIFDPPLTLGGQPSFVRAKDPAVLKARLREAFARETGDALEARLMRRNVPVSKLRDIATFAKDAVSADALPVTTLESDGVTVLSPGLGFRVTPHTR